MASTGGVSVVIPTLQPAYLADCLAGLERQSTPTMEVIIVENGERHPGVTQLTKEYCHKMDVRHIYLPEPGANRARNAGAESARYDVLAFLDDDCVPEHNWIDAILCDKEMLQGLAVGGGQVALEFLVDPPGWFAGVFRDSVSELRLGAHARALHGDEYLVSANLFVAKDIFQRFGGFSENLGIRGKTGPQLGNDEVEFIRRLARDGIKLQYYPSATVRHLIPEYRLDPRRLAMRRFGQGISDVVLEIHENPTIPVARVCRNLYGTSNNRNWLHRVKTGQASMTRPDAASYYTYSYTLQSAYLTGIVCGTVQSLSNGTQQNLHLEAPELPDGDPGGPRAAQAWSEHRRVLRTMLTDLAPRPSTSSP